MAIKFLNTVAVDTDVLYVDASSNNVGIGTTSPHFYNNYRHLTINGTSGAGFMLKNGGSNKYEQYVDGGGAVFYLFDNDPLKFYTSGIERLRVTGTGNVGIGTTNPLYPLQVAGNAYINNGTLFIDSGRRIKWGNSNQWIEGTNDTSLEFSGGGGGTQMILTSTGNVGIGTTSLSQKLEVAGNVKLDGDNRHIYFGGNNTFIGERSNSTELELRGGGNSSAQTVYIDNTGNLGIGTSNPVQKLHVTGNARVTGAYYDSNNLPGTSGQVLSSTATGTDWVSLSEISGVDGTGTTNYVAKWSDSDTITDSVIYDDGTNVGIGTTSPQSKLQINGGYGLTVTASDGAYTDGYFGRIQSDYGTNALRIVSRSGDVFRATNYGQDVAILTGTPAAGTSERIRITSSGNVGINKTAPAAKFHVNGSTIITLPSTGNYFKIEGDVDNNLFYAKNDSIGIGTTSPTRKLTVNGSADVFDSLLINSNTPATDATTNAELVIQAKGNQAGTIRSSQWYFQTIPDSIYGNSAFRIAKNYDGGATSEFMRINSAGNVGIGTTSPNYKLEVNGGARAGGVVTYSKNYGSLDTTGNAVAGLTTGFNGASAGFTFTCFGHGGYQKVVYSCYNVSGTWNTIKVIDEGTNAFDVEASANATTITFTFKSTSGTKSYTPRVTVEATGSAINSTYA